MKKLISAACILMFICISTYAQQKDSVVTLPEVIITSKWMVNETIDKAFLKTFSSADDVSWRKLNKDYLALFIMNDLKHQALYKKNGWLKYDITYYNEKSLPENVVSMVRDAYPSYLITNGARIFRADQVFWIINLEGATNYAVVRAEDGDLSEVRKIVKSAVK